MKYIKHQIVKNCYNECKFYSSSMDGMTCCHPYFDDKVPYDNMIITHKNSRNGNIPEKCPLRINNAEVVYVVSLG